MRTVTSDFNHNLIAWLITGSHDIHVIKFDSRTAFFLTEFIVTVIYLFSRQGWNLILLLKHWHYFSQVNLLSILLFLPLTFELSWTEVCEIFNIQKIMF